MPYCEKCKQRLGDFDDFDEHECPKDQDDGFLTSLIIGSATDSAVLGGLLGGNITGGILGDALDGDLMD